MVRFILILLISTVRGFPGHQSRTNNIVTNSFAGPFKLLLRRFEDCPLEMRGKNVFQLTGTIKKTPKYLGARYYGNLKTLQPFEDDVVMHASVASWNTAVGWVPDTFNIKFEQLCSTLNIVFKDAVDFIEDHEINNQTLCPRDVGNFTVEALPTAYDMKNLIPFRYGRWRADLECFRAKERLACIRSIFETVPIISYN